MKKILLLTVAAVSIFAANQAQNLFDAKCSMCHIKTMPQDRSKLVAPPIMGVMRHVKMKYASKEEAVAFIADYVRNPSKEKALCMPKKIKYFGLMPSQKENVTTQEAKQIAGWLYDNFPPKGFLGHGMGMKR